MKIVRKLKNAALAVKAARQTLKFGGINTIRVETSLAPQMLQGKRIIVTGSGSGIGYAIAKKCADCGAQVIMTGRNAEKIRNAAGSIDSMKCTAMVWDIQDVALAQEKIAECREIFGGDIDILVNNAGVQPREFFPNVSEEEWNRIYDINSKGTFFISQAFCEFCKNNPRQTGYRKILNIDSQGGFVGATYPYRMTKWDIRGLTQGLGLAMAPHGVLVNGIAPGVIKTEMQSFSLAQKDNTYCRQNPLGRVALPEEIAELAAFMLSDSCNFMVGQTILADGGYSLK